ncbi:adenylyltransferase/cytidyltransferase family protein [Candidatus Falkowbacteria bacterium]|nr:adenylyltransferase/cytidyltransferase family protein [Candidatus Falkowbacteria bacterium]
MRKVLVFGTFDLFHPGHRSFLRQARRYGDKLYAVIARDRTVLAVKKALPLQDELSRLAAVRDSGLVDEAVLGSLRDKYLAIKKVRPDVICLGYDQIYLTDTLASKLEQLGIATRIVKLKSYRPDIYKSSKLKAKQI